MSTQSADGVAALAMGAASGVRTVARLRRGGSLLSPGPVAAYPLDRATRRTPGGTGDSRSVCDFGPARVDLAACRRRPSRASPPRPRTSGTRRNCWLPGCRGTPPPRWPSIVTRWAAARCVSFSTAWPRRRMRPAPRGRPAGSGPRREELVEDPRRHQEFRAFLAGVGFYVVSRPAAPGCATAECRCL